MQFNCECFAVMMASSSLFTLEQVTWCSPETSIVCLKLYDAQKSGVALCHDFKRGEGCWDVATRNKIEVSDFTKWNAGVGSDCTAMWAEIYVCVGV